MTNAHVVSWARQILVLKYQDPRPFLAHVEYVGHDCDLAVLKVQDPRFMDGLKPLSFGELPVVQSTVQTCGYPAGGEQISYTRGVVSRIEVQPYVHIGNRSFLAVQTDAAINPGNSGGPVFQDDKVVGVAFQGQPGLENAGFFIPPSVVSHFLTDIEDGQYHGFPQAGIRLAALQNPAYRKHLGLEGSQVGAIIDNIVAIPTTQERLRPEDVLLAVDGRPVATDGTILYNNNRLAVSAAFQFAQHGESLQLEVWRNRQKVQVKLPVFFNKTDRLVSNQYDTPPPYFIYAGLVFTPLSLDYVKTFGRDWITSARSEIIYELYYRPYEKPETVREQPVVLSTILDHSANANFGTRGGAIVDEINGVKINSMKDLIQGLEARHSDQHVFRFLGSKGIECLDRQAADNANTAILRTYGLVSDRRL